MEIREKAKAYDDAIKVIKDNLDALNEITETGANTVNIQSIKNCFYRAFPELKKTNKNENIKESIKKILANTDFKRLGVEYSFYDMVNWLEKQGEHDNFLSKIQVGDRVTRNEDGVLVNISQLNGVAKKDEKQGEQSKEVIYTHEVETGNGNIKTLVTEKVQLPKFKVGDWVVECYSKGPLCILDYDDPHGYKYGDLRGKSFWTAVEYANKYWRLWSIRDAKPGDVLVASNDSIFIYAGSTARYAKYYAALTKYGSFQFTFNPEGGNWDIKNSVYPATKEQRELLFRKMKESGYEWMLKNRELIPLQQEVNKSEFNPDGIIEESHQQQADDLIDMVTETTWSKEDEYMLNETIQHLEELIRIDKAKHCACDVQYYQRDIDWLKSLKQRYTWKPSKEQIVALRWILNNIPYNKHKEEISGLLDQIKDL